MRLITCGMYPTILPGTWWPGNAGGLPSTVILPREIFRVPTMHLSSVVLPHPLGPSRLYLQREIWDCLLRAGLTRGPSGQSEDNDDNRGGDGRRAADKLGKDGGATSGGCGIHVRLMTLLSTVYHCLHSIFLF